MREALLNAIVHREWDTSANISISMFDNRIEVTSPGTLPPGLSENEYVNSRISLPRNPILANVFFVLRYIEKFGTGTTRIRESYAKHPQKPAFIVQSNSICVVLPVISDANLTHDEELVIDILSGGKVLSRQGIQTLMGFEKDKTIRLLNSLNEKGFVEKRGEGRSVRYQSVR